MVWIEFYKAIRLAKTFVQTSPTSYGKIQTNFLANQVRSHHHSQSGFLCGSEVKNRLVKAGNVRDAGSIPRWGRSPGEGNGKPLQILAWEIPWTEESGRLQSTGSQRFRQEWATEHTHARTHTHTHTHTHAPMRLWCWSGGRRSWGSNEWRGAAVNMWNFACPPPAVCPRS